MDVGGREPVESLLAYAPHGTIIPFNPRLRLQRASARPISAR